MNIFSIETSCDETACAVVKDGIIELASSLATSKEIHESTGGVVPEIAARKQVEAILPVINSCLEKFSSIKEDIDAIAVTIGPGLIGSLIVGIEAAKALALAWNKPLIPVNHLIGHIYANFLEEDRKENTTTQKNILFPAIALVVSGGHTDLVLIKNHGDLEYLGGTIDDAAGEAFDKTARLLKLSNYLGGVLLSKKAAECKENTLQGRFPRPMINQDNYDFSFSGLKTAVKRIIENEHYPSEVVACEFENAVCDVLVFKTIKAAKEFNVKSILMGGGVAANKQLRQRLKQEAEALDISFYTPSLKLCGDNAVYIASAAYFNMHKVSLNNLESVQPNPSLSVMDKV